MNTTAIINTKDVTVREHSVLDSVLVVSIPATSSAWANREAGEFRDSLAGAGIKFPLMFLVRMHDDQPLTMTGDAMKWSSERNMDFHTAVPCDTFVADALCSFIWDIAMEAVGE